MIKQEVDIKILAAYLKPNLLTDERETGPEFDQEFADVGEKSLLDGLLFGFLSERQKLELVGILERLAGEVDWGLGKVRWKFVWAFPWRS